LTALNDLISVMTHVLTKMINRFLLAISAAILVGRSYCAAQSATTNGVLEISVDVRTVSPDPLFGMGIQWDPYSYSPREEGWQETYRRLDYIHPAFFRVMTGGQSYGLSFDSGHPQYVWAKDETEIRHRLGDLLKILDYAESNKIDVILGEWRPPGRIGNTLIDRPDDPRWAQMASDFVSWLRNDRRYDVITKFNLMNEPNGRWMWPDGKVDYTAWAAGVKNLRHELDLRGLKEVSIVGPDNAWDWDWLDRATHDQPQCFGDWEMHWYATDQEILGGEISRTLEAKRAVIFKNDPLAKSKQLFLAESGMLTGKTNGDQQPRVRTFEYGVLMSDYAAQVMQAGWRGLCAWDLDDAMHTVRGHPSVPNQDTLKVWGFWNTQGTAMGHPEDEAPRPWFYTWSLMSRLFPRGANLLSVNYTAVPNLRVVAASVHSGQTYSVIIVNDSDGPRSVNLKIPKTDRHDLSEYHYFKEDRPVDTSQFPQPAKTTINADVTNGLRVSLPGRGVIFLEAK